MSKSILFFFGYNELLNLKEILKTKDIEIDRDLLGN